MGITRHNEPQRKHPAPRAPDDTYGITEVVAYSSKSRPTRAVPSSGQHQSASSMPHASRPSLHSTCTPHTIWHQWRYPLGRYTTYFGYKPSDNQPHFFQTQTQTLVIRPFRPWFDHGRELHLAADGSSSSRMHSSSSKHLLRILDTKQIGTKLTFLAMLLYVRAYHHASIHHCYISM